MTFKEVREGYRIHFIAKGKDGLHHEVNTVINVSAPYFPTQTGISNMASSLNSMARYIDITVPFKGVTTTYTVNENSCVTEAPGNIILAVDKESILRELEAMKTNASEALSQIETHKKTIEDCDKILEELNPDLAEKKAQEKRIQTLENQVNGMSGMLEKILAAVNK